MCACYQGDSNQGTLRSTMGEGEHYYRVFGSKPPQEATVPHAGRLIIKSVPNGSFITFGDGVSRSHEAISASHSDSIPLCFFSHNVLTQCPGSKWTAMRHKTFEWLCSLSCSLSTRMRQEKPLILNLLADTAHVPKASL